MLAHDLSRVLCAAQTHRRMVDPMSFRRWNRPFAIERVESPAASTQPELAQGDTTVEAGGRQDSSL